MKKNIKCDKKIRGTQIICGYEWDTKSTHVFVSCPSCLGKPKNPNAAKAP